MIEYNLIISKRAENDLDKIIARKREYETYESNIDRFIEDVDGCYDRLETFPNSGHNLSSRVKRKTNKKYFVIEERYLMIYEIFENGNVKVSRVLDSKTNWQALKL